MSQLNLPLASNSSSNPDDIFEIAKLAGLDPTEAFSKEDLSGRNLSKYDLRNFNLRGTILNGSDLSQAKLNGANLHDAQLCGASLIEATLCGARLPDADLKGANLRRANLKGADLRRANLRKADLDDAIFTGANVQGAKFGGNSGLTQEMKRNLKSQGASFEYFMDEGNSSIQKDIKWWLQFVILPLVIACIGSGGILSIITTFTRKPSPANLVDPVKPPTQITPLVKPMPMTKPTHTGDL
jgi:uncharacterized protein YjbI with pentapeptide repeats